MPRHPSHDGRDAEGYEEEDEKWHRTFRSESI
jgi:hypothetical protein